MKHRRTVSPALRIILLPFLLTSLGLVSCRSFSSEIAPADSAAGTVMTEWEGDFDDHLLGSHHTCRLPDGRILTLKRTGWWDFYLQSFSGTLQPGYVKQIPLEDDEHHLNLATFDGQTLLFSQIERDDDVRSVHVREIDTRSGDLSASRELLTTDAGFGGRFLMDQSPDSSWVLLYGVSDVHDSRDPDRGRRSYQVLYGVLVNMRTGDASTTRISLIYPYRQAEGVHRGVAVSDFGKVAIIQVQPGEERGYDVVLHYVDGDRINRRRYPLPSRLDSLLPSYSGADYAEPSGVAGAFHTDGSIVGATDLKHNDRTQLLLNFSIDPVSFDIEFDAAATFDQRAVTELTDGELEHLSDDYFVSDVITHRNGAVTVLHESHSFSRWTTQYTRRSYTSESRSHHPLLVSHIDYATGHVRHFYIRRYEEWKPADLAFYEGGHTHKVSGDTLFLALRNRDSGGIVHYTIDLYGDQEGIERRVLARLGERAYYVPRMTLWNEPQDVVLFIKAGENGRDWQMMRVSP